MLNVALLHKQEKNIMKNVWLIGAGPMAMDYTKVLQNLDVNFIIVGRDKESALKIKQQFGVEPVLGGLDSFLDTNPEPCSHAIVAVGVELLFDLVSKLMDYGVKNILVEKPGALNKDEISSLESRSKSLGVNLLIAYNRRFYASVEKAKQIIENDGGVTSFNFEFTEWSHKIAPLSKGDGVKEKWFLANSTHVVDLAFYLGGKPIELSCFTDGHLDWHPTASNFSGAGISDAGALFNYQANWESAGRWSVEILTKEHRLIFTPIEKLQIQKRGSILQEFDESIDYDVDDRFKPGLFKQVLKFINNDFSDMCDISEQAKVMNYYYKMANYL